MKKEMISFIQANGLKPFNKIKTQIKTTNQTIFKTKDAKSVHTRALNIINRQFVFSETSNLLEFFDTFPQEQQITKKQEFFKYFVPLKKDFLKQLKQPKPFWNPDYGIVVVTEEDSTFQTLQKLGCNVKFLADETDLSDLERYDIVQVIDCENFSLALEKLPQTVFLHSIEEAYLERHVRTLSGWNENLQILKQAESHELKSLVEKLASLSYLFNKSETKKLSREFVEEKLEKIKADISKKVKEQNISGDLLLEVLNKGTLPLELKKIVKESINNSGLPENLFLQQIPVQIDEKELEKEIRNQDLNKFANAAEEIKKNSRILVQIPEKISELEIQLLIYDFNSTLSEWMQNKKFPTISKEFSLEQSANEFLDNPSPINFHLNEQSRCSMLTGANSGGKTTLIEHAIQLISYAYLGLPTNGKFSTPLFTELYYFAKNKGSANKGTFETLLTQLSKITPGEKTLILADEIEAVTEPGIAGKIIAASAKYFINQGCFIIFATHLGQEIQKILPDKARIDGIEAKGLDEFNELIVDHNPVIGKLASSTPELIVEKMAKTSQLEYLKFLNDSLKKV
jgi:DNA mismatch repair ATPase MutS